MLLTAACEAPVLMLSSVGVQGRAVMTFKAGTEEVRVPLPRRALQVCI